MIKKLLLILIIISVSILFFVSFLPDFTIYGRVLDQYAQPVVGARVTYEGTHSFLSAGSGLGYVTTDEKGNFVIHANGNSLVLAEIKHPDISYSYPFAGGYGKTTTNAMYSITRRQIKFRNGGADTRYENAQPYTNSNHPFVISTYRLSGYEGAYSKQERFRLNADGRIYTIFFKKEHGANEIQEGVVPGQLHVSCTRKHHMVNLKDYGDWSFSIKPVDGGIQPTEDIYLNEAPESGYQPSYDINMKRSDPKYMHTILNQRLFFTTNQGKKYGALYANFEPHFDWRAKIDWCSLTLIYKFNNTGSRNLELDGLTQ